MTDFSITSPDLDRLIKLFETAPEITGEETRKAMEAAVLVAEGEVVKRTPVDTGRLRGAISSRVEGSGAEIVGVVEVNQVAYSVPVEVGTKPHFPPSKAIEPWVRRVLHVSDPKEVKHVAFLVARKISRTGTKPRNMFRDGAKAAEPRIERFFENAVKRIAERLDK